MRSKHLNIVHTKLASEDLQEDQTAENNGFYSMFFFSTTYTMGFSNIRYLLLHELPLQWFYNQPLSRTLFLMEGRQSSTRNK